MSGTGTPAPRIGTEDEQSVHREPAPSPAEHNAAINDKRANDQLGRAW